MIKNWVFHFCRNALRLPLGVFVRKIHFDGMGNLPKGKPIFLAGNHPNSFLDGVIYEHMSGWDVYTLTRGDVFNKPFANYVFRSMKLLPIFRARDASSDVARKGNADTMNELFDHFKKDSTILIFSEGSSYPEKAVRRLKKGTGHIAVEMIKRSDFTLDLQIVPTAINYSKFGSLMQTIHVTFGEPIRLLDFESSIQEDSKKVAEQITEQLQAYLQDHVVVTKGDFSVEKEFVHQMMINENYQPYTYKSKDTWSTTTAKLNTMSESMASEVRKYQDLLKTHRVDDANVGSRSFDALSVLLAIFTFGVSFPTYLIWKLIWKAITNGVDNNVKNVVFHDSLKVGFGMFASLFLTIISGVVFFNLFSSIWAIFFTISAIYGGICWFRVVDLLPYFIKQITWVGLSDKVKKDLFNQRQLIVQHIT